MVAPDSHVPGKLGMLLGIGLSVSDKVKPNSDDSDKFSGMTTSPGGGGLVNKSNRKNNNNKER